MSRDVEGMLESCEQLGRGLQSLLDDLAAAEGDAAPRENEPVPINELASKALRERVLSDLSAGGVTMEKIGGVSYQTPLGIRVAMPFSHHLGGGRWFLDTPHERNFDEVLLPCAADDGVRHFHLTRRFLRDNLGTGLNRCSCVYQLFIQGHARARWEAITKPESMTKYFYAL